MAEKKGIWTLRREHPGGLTHLIRLLLALIASAGIWAGVFAILKDSPAEAGGTAILVGSIVLLLLALIGRFPDKLSGGGWEVEFRPDTIRQIVALVQSESPELAAQVEELLRSGSRPSDAVNEVLKTVGEDRVADASFEQRVRASVKALPGAHSLEEDIEIKTPGVGRRPIVDVMADFGSEKVVFEIKSNWTPSVSDFTIRRLKRALLAEDVSKAVLVVASQFYEQALADVGDQVSLADGLQDRLLVVSGEAIDSIPARLGLVTSGKA